MDRSIAFSIRMDSYHSYTLIIGTAYCNQYNKLHPPPPPLANFPKRFYQKLLLGGAQAQRKCRRWEDLFETLPPHIEVEIEISLGVCALPVLEKVSFRDTHSPEGRDAHYV